MVLLPQAVDSVKMVLLQAVDSVKHLFSFQHIRFLN